MCTDGIIKEVVRGTEEQPTEGAHRKKVQKVQKVPGKIALSLTHGCAYHPEALRVSIPAGYGSLRQLHRVGWEIA